MGYGGKDSTSSRDFREGRDILIEGIRNLFLNHQYSDIIVTCKGQRWPCHKAILCPRSTFFAAACKKEWQKGEFREISLEDDEPLAVNEMLRYLYTGQYHDVVAETQEQLLPPLLLNVHLYTMGDKYDIPDLCKIAEERFIATASDKWDTTEFADAIAEIYQTLPDTKGVLHTTVVGVASRNAKQLYTRDDCQRFREVAAETPKFMSEMFGILITEGFPAKGEARYECMDCLGTMVFKIMDLHKSYPCPYNDCRSRVMPYCRLGREWKML